MASRRSIDLYHSNGGVRQQEWPKKDMVNHPEHYMKGGMETIEYLKAKSTPQGFQTYLRLNAMKISAELRPELCRYHLKKTAERIGMSP